MVDNIVGGEHAVYHADCIMLSKLHKVRVNVILTFFPPPVHFRQGHLSMVVLLMSFGADPSLRDGEGGIFTAVFCEL